MSSEKPPQKKVAFIMPVDLLEQMRALAALHRRSLVGEIVWALRQYVAAQARQEGREGGEHDTPR